MIMELLHSPLLYLLQVFNSFHNTILGSSLSMYWQMDVKLSDHLGWDGFFFAIQLS